MKIPDTAPLSEPYSNGRLNRRSGRQSGAQSLLRSERLSGSLFRRKSWHQLSNQPWGQSRDQSENQPTGRRSEFARKHTFGACLNARLGHLTNGEATFGLLIGRGTARQLLASWTSHAVLENSASCRSLTSFEPRWAVSRQAKPDLNNQDHVQEHVLFRQMKAFLSHFFSYLGFSKSKQCHANKRLKWGWVANSSIDLALLELSRLMPFAAHGSRVTGHGSRLAGHGSRFMAHIFAYILILGLFLKMCLLRLRIALGPIKPFSSAPFPQKSAMEPLDYRIGVINCGQLSAAPLRCKITSLTEDLLSTMFGQRP